MGDWDGNELVTSARMWSGWHDVGRLPYIEDIQVARASDGRLTVFVEIQNPARNCQGTVPTDLHIVQCATQTGDAPDRWTGWLDLGGKNDGSRQVAMAALHDDRMFVMGLDGPTSNATYMRWQNSRTSDEWSPWQTFWSVYDIRHNGPTFYYFYGGLWGRRVIALERNGRGRLELYLLDKGFQIWCAWQTSDDPADWSGWLCLGNPCNLPPDLGGVCLHITTAHAADGSVEVFVVGPGGHVFRRRQNGSPDGGWFAWEDLGGSVDRIEVVRGIGDNRLAVFGFRNNGPITYTMQDGDAPGGWTPWASLGGSWRAIAAAVNSDGRMEVFARGQDDVLRHIWQDGSRPSGWSDWQSLGIRCFHIAVAPDRNGRPVLFVNDYGTTRLGSETIRCAWQLPDATALRPNMPRRFWSAWQPMGIGTDGPPPFTTPTFAPSQAVDSAAAPPGWMAWEVNGRPVQIATSPNDEGRLEIFAVAPDFGLYHLWRDAGMPAGRLGWECVLVAADCRKIFGGRNGGGRLEVITVGSQGMVRRLCKDAASPWGWSVRDLGESLMQATSLNAADGRTHWFTLRYDLVMEHVATGADNDWPESEFLGMYWRRVAAALGAEGRMELFGIDTEGAPSYRWQAPDTPMGWWLPQRLGEPCAEIAASLGADGRPAAFVLSPDGALGRIQPDAAVPGGWSERKWVGAGYTQVAAGRDADGRPAIYALSADGALAQTRPDAAAPDGWSAMETIADGGWPVPVVRGADGHPLLVFGPDDALYEHWVNGTLPAADWAGGRDLLEQPSLQIASGRTSSGRLDVFALECDGLLRHTVLLGTAPVLWARWEVAAVQCTRFALLKREDGGLDLFLVLGGELRCMPVGEHGSFDERGNPWFAAWTTPEALLKEDCARVAAGVGADGLPAIFTVSRDGTLAWASRHALRPRSWFGNEEQWTPLGADCRDVTVSIGADGLTELFAVGTDGTLRHARPDGTAPGGWSAWTVLGDRCRQVMPVRADGGFVVYAAGVDEPVATLRIGPDGAAGPWTAWEVHEVPSRTGARTLAARVRTGWLDALVPGLRGTLDRIALEPRELSYVNEWDGVGRSPGDVTLARDGAGRVALFAIGTEGGLYQTWRDKAASVGWRPWQRLGGAWRQMAALRNRDGQIEVFAIDVHGSLQHLRQDDASPTGWSTWQTLDGTWRQVVPARGANGHVELYAIDADQMLRRGRADASAPGGWSWQGLDMWGHQIAVGYSTDGRLELFAVDGGKSVSNRPQDRTAPWGWGGWRALGGIVRRIVVARDAEGRMELFAIGTDERLRHRRQDRTSPTGWTDWADLGIRCTMVAVGRGADGRLDLFAIEPGGTLMHSVQAVEAPGGWSAWEPLARRCARVAVAADDDGALGAIVVGTDGSLGRIRQRPQP